MKTIRLKEMCTTDTSYWDERRNRIFSANGGWKLGYGVTSYGRDLLSDILPNDSYFQFLILSASGMQVELNVAKWMEAAFLCTSWPDPRIWCNTVGVYAADTGSSPSAAISAGVLASDSEIYGARVGIQAMTFIQKAVEDYNSGLSASNILENELAASRGRLMIKGFARPVATGDERVEALRKYAEKLGLKEKEHVKLAFELEKTIQERFGESLNIA